MDNTSQKMQPKDKNITVHKTVYYDGSCPMCTAFRNSVERSDTREQFTFVDATTADIPSNLSKDAIMQEMHVVDEAGKVYTNADSVLSVLKEFPVWRPFVWLGSLPFLRPVFTFSYNRISAQRHFIFGTRSRIFWVKVVTTIGLLASLLLTQTLWYGDRVFPKVPVLSNSTVPTEIEMIFFVVLVASVLGALLLRQARVCLLISVATLAVFVLLDQMRLQPWVYQYGSIFVLLSLFSWRYVDVEEQEKILNALRLIMAAIYFYSGLQKLNIVFISSIFPWMAEPITSLIPGDDLSQGITLGLFVPIIEMAIGVGLLFRKTRMWALYGAGTMLLFVLFALGPLGHNWNSSVWPWNIAFFLLAFILFNKTPTLTVRDVVWPRTGAHTAIFILFACAPVLFFANFWDSYLSFSLYSGNPASATITLDRSASDVLPNIAQTHIKKIEDEANTVRLNYFLWSYDELNVPIYPEPRVYRAVGKWVCQATKNNPDVEVVIHPRAVLVRKQLEHVYTCADL